MLYVILAGAAGGMICLGGGGWIGYSFGYMWGHSDGQVDERARQAEGRIRDRERLAAAANAEERARAWHTRMNAASLRARVTGPFARLPIATPPPDADTVTMPAADGQPRASYLAAS